jgi:beta-glucosidase/6-phospho-beta-glucosidase/beta-galactosidase
MASERDSFFWGVATSAYQAEGGYNGPGQPQTNWAPAEARGDVATTGKAVEFWTRYAEDFARCQAMGLNAFRLGLDWTRLEPERGKFDAAALAHYAAMLNSCRAHGLEPVVTLHHFTHPAWLGPDAWLQPETSELFGAHVAQLLEKLTPLLDSPLHWFITINEPNMLVLNTYLGRQFPAKGHSGFTNCIRAYNHLLRAHLLAYRAIHEFYAREKIAPPQVTFNNYCSDLYWSDKVLLDLMSAPERGIARKDLHDYIHAKDDEFSTAFTAARIPLHKDLPYYFGALMKRVSNWFGDRAFRPEAFAPLLDALYAAPSPRNFDYIGLDYYDPFAAHAFRLPVWWDHEFKNRSTREWLLNSITSKWWDWRVLPRGMHFFCDYYARDFQRSVLIAENGMALRRKADNSATRRSDRMTRSRFLKLHVHQIERMQREGIPVLGYLHWSLFDNYEWGSYTPRFGLLAVDYAQGTDRLVEDHLQDRPSETYATLVREAREKQRTH